MTNKHYLATNEDRYDPAGIIKIKTDIVPKVWGTEECIINKEYCIKVMRLRPGYQVSLHWHSNKKETFVLIKGNLTIETVNTTTAEINKTILTVPFSSFTLEKDVPHTFYTEDSEEVIFLEGSTYDDIFDSYRIFPSRKRE